MNYAKKKTGAEHFSITLRSAPAVINLSKKIFIFHTSKPRSTCCKSGGIYCAKV